MLANTVAPLLVAATSSPMTAGPGMTQGNGIVVIELLVQTNEPGTKLVSTTERAAAELKVVGAQAAVPATVEIVAPLVVATRKKLTCMFAAACDQPKPRP